MQMEKGIEGMREQKVRPIDGTELIKWLNSQKNEYSHVFADTAYSNVRNIVMSGHFDIPKDGGGA